MRHVPAERDYHKDFVEARWDREDREASLGEPLACFSPDVANAQMNMR